MESYNNITSKKIVYELRLINNPQIGPTNFNGLIKYQFVLYVLSILGINSLKMGRMI